MAGCGVPLFPSPTRGPGPTHFTEDRLCAPAAKARIEEVCRAIVEHIKGVDHHHYTVSRMVLYFKEVPPPPQPRLCCWDSGGAPSPAPPRAAGVQGEYGQKRDDMSNTSQNRRKATSTSKAPAKAKKETHKKNKNKQL